MSIPSIRKNSYYENDIIVYVDQDTDGTVEWLKENNVRYILNDSLEPKGIGNAYDTMFKEASTDLVMAFHADMALGYHADYYMMKKHELNKVVCATCIEPPNLHPPGSTKLIEDFGMWPEEFDLDRFNDFVKTLAVANEGRVTPTMFVPWLINKSQHVGHDSVFLSVFEDTDLFRRFKLAGYELEQTWEAYVYHLTCRGGQFEHATKTEDLTRRSDDWKRKSDLSTKEFIRKWGGYPKATAEGEPTPNIKYNIAFVVDHCNFQILEVLEPWCDRIYIDDEMQVLHAHYMDQEQKNTKFNLNKRVLSKEYNNPVGENDIIIKFDGRQLTSDNLQTLLWIPDILTESGEVGDFELDIFQIKVQSLETYQQELVTVHSDYYTNKLI
jgi:glycosyltransferase involved in cell wall biosynthesis